MTARRRPVKVRALDHLGERRSVTRAVFIRALRAQRVPRDHLAFACPMCGRVHSLASLRQAGAHHERAERLVAFSCEGRLRGAGQPPAWTPPPHVDGPACDWTLGGLLSFHTIEVDGRPYFRPAPRTLALALRRRVVAEAVRTAWQDLPEGERPWPTR